MVGGALGVLFAVGATRLIVALIPPDYVPNEARIVINGWVLLFSLGVSMLTGILFGLAPALRSSRPDLVGTLKDGGGGATGSVRGRAMRSWLVVAEISLSVILLAGASLAVRGFVQILHVDPGFQPEKVLRIDVTLAPKRYPTWQQRNVLDRNLLESVMNLPGVQAASLGNGGLPYSGWRSSFSIDGQPRVEGRKVAICADQRPVSADARDSAETRARIYRGGNRERTRAWRSSTRVPRGFGRRARTRWAARCRSTIWRNR